MKQCHFTMIAAGSDEGEVCDDMDQSMGGGQLANLSVQVHLEHAAFLDFKIHETEFKTVVSAVAETIRKEQEANGGIQGTDMVETLWHSLVPNDSSYCPFNSVCICIKCKIREQLL